jgi:uncharacterized protein YqfA (UPF0365 family)
MEILILLAVAFGLFYFIPFGHYYWSRKSGLDISLSYMIGMRIRKAQIKTIIDSLVEAKISKVDVRIQDLEALNLAGGNPLLVIKDMTKAKSNGIDLSFKDASQKHLLELERIEKESK